MSDLLAITTFGGVGIRLNGQLITGFVSRKAEVLLVYLALTRHVVSRETLAELFWEERTQTQSASNLRTVLTNLRQLLPNHVLIDRHTVQLNPEAGCWMDAVQLETDLQTISQHWQQVGLPSATAVQLAQTLRLYQGEFLAGVTLRDSSNVENWVQHQRERLHHLVIEGLHHLVNSYLAHGDYQQGIAQASRLLQLDPLREETYRQMMLLLFKAGQRGAALAQYETCRQILADELGIEPAAETEVLYKAIYRGELSQLTGDIVQEPPQSQSYLPPQTASFVGRVTELAYITDRLADPACHLLTIVGPGGIGKTRLAIEAAYQHQREYANGTYFVALAPVTSPDLLVSTIGSTLQFAFQGNKEPKAQLLDYLRDKQVLLILDNFEHLLEGVSLFSELLAAAPALKILVTSRQRLNLAEEWVVPLDGLDLPAANDVHPETYSAIQLFVQRAKRILPTFNLGPVLSIVVTICQLVDGMPLGLEMAAGWLPLLTPDQIAEHIEVSLDFLSSPLSNVPARHRSMRAVFEQSWQMLNAQEQLVLASLSVFRGGFDLSAAEQVAKAQLPVLASLADKSLLRRNAAGRYDVHELLRQFAAEKLDSMGLTAQVKHRHLHYFRQLGQQAEPMLLGPYRAIWVGRLEVERDNLNAALQWSLEGGDTQAGLELATALAWWWTSVGKNEGEVWLDRLLTATKHQPPTLVQAKAACRLSEMATLRGIKDQEWADQALAISQAVQDPLCIGAALKSQALALTRHRRHRAALPLAEESLRLLKTLDVPWELAQGKAILAWVLEKAHQAEQAATLHGEGLAFARTIGDPFSTVWFLYGLGGSALAKGHVALAKAYYQESLTILPLHRRDLLATALSLIGLGWTQFLEHDYDQASVSLEESVTLAQEYEYKLDIPWALRGLGHVKLAQGDDGQAVTLFKQAISASRAVADSAGIALALAGLGLVALVQDKKTEAARLFGAVQTHERQLGDFSLWASERIEYNRSLDAVRQNLSDATFANAYEEGQALTLERAVALAMKLFPNS